MDRNKPALGTRGPKSKITQQPPDLFIALGAKAGSSRDSDPKRNVPILPKSTQISSPNSKVPPPDRKRENSSTSLGSGPPSKKLKVLSRPPTGVPGPSMSTILSNDRIASPGVEPWEAAAIEIEAVELFAAVVDALKVNNNDKAVGLILGGIRNLRSTQRFKPCKVSYNAILLICQIRPSLFAHDLIVQGLMSSLKRDVSGGMKANNKGNQYNQIIFINILLYAFADVANWPETFLRMYAEDAVGDRIWIDNIYCKPFVDNITAAFNTKQPPRSMLQPESWVLPSGRDTGSPLTITSNDDDEATAEHRQMVESWNIKVFNRYTHIPQEIEHLILEVIQEQITRRQQPEAITKNFVRLLSTTSGMVEIRIIAVARLETWLHNHKLMKPAQELLAYLCYNCSASTQRDLEVVVQLSKLRLKNKPMVIFFNYCLREMVIAFPENLYPLLKYTIFNELSNARNSNNLFVVAAMFQVEPEASADAFADICLELLLNKDDYLRSLRALFKEINRVLKHDFNLPTVVHSLLRERKDMEKIIRESEVKDRLFVSLTDLVAMCMLLCVTPQVRDAATQSKRDFTVLHAFQTQVSNIQREAVTWLHDWGFKVFRPSAMDCQHSLLKLVLLEQPEHYYKVDSWPGENERILFLRLASEVPLLQATLLRILLIGISKENPINPNDVIEIAEQLIRRVSNIAPLEMDKIEIIDFFFNLCSYNYPENIALPVGYVPPKLAISTLYWKVWMMLLILAAHNPVTFGSLAWEKYPTLRMFMEMCITNFFAYPPPTMITGDGSYDYILKDQQILSIERQTILEFETHLAAGSTKAEITEQSSLLLPQLMELNPSSPARQPPPHLLEQLNNLNSTLKLGHLLCKSRQPDFLLDIMTRHGGTAHMPWLAELVHSSGSLAHLPVQCLCEYLLSTGPTEKLTKHTQLLAHLRRVVNGPDASMACEVLEYLLRRLTSLHASSRAPAIRGLTMILSPGEDIDQNSASIGKTVWLTQYILQFPHLPSIRQTLIPYLRQATLLETNPTHVANYIGFLAEHGLDDSLPELFEMVFDLATLIIERNSITHYILPGENNDTVKALISVFWVYLQKARESSDSFYLSENQDHVLVTWANGEQCTLPTLTIHASIILLTYGPIEKFEAFDGMLDLWFPVNEEHPKASLIDLSEEVIMAPDWLKLRMIRSNVPRLLDAAVEKLEAPQLVLFIQSFGIPVVSISKLLKVLDRVTVTNPNLVIDSVLDKNYMIQLVDVQNRRGALGGKIFVKALEMQTPQLYEEDMHVDFESRKMAPSTVTKKSEKHSPNELVTAVKKIFYPKYASDSSEQINFVCKILTTGKDKEVSEVIDVIQKMAAKDLEEALNNWAVQTVLKCLMTKKYLNERTCKLGEYLLTILKQNQNSNPLINVIKQFLSEYQESSKMDVSTSIDDISGKLSDTLLDNSRALAKQISNMLINKENVEKTGLLVDWLATVELEMANVDSNKVQMELLFANQQLSFRPLLTSIVLQRASWKTLNNVIDYLLIPDNVSKNCPSSVLDFLTALTQCPRLWQGRDKSVPKHFKSEDVLHLNNKRILTVIDYILEEYHLEMDDIDKMAEKTMERRLSLIIIAMNNSDTTEQVVKKLVGLEHQQSAMDLLLMLYMNLPRVVSYLSNRQFASFRFAKTSRSALDLISHTILSALTANTRVRDKEWTAKSHDLELCARKLAATHPDLVLRQLPMLAACLRGRALYDWNVLRSRGHFLLFGQIIGLMELLQPSIYQETETLCALLDSFIDLLKYHGHNKELNNIVPRIVTFLQNWMMQDMQSSLKYLQKYGYVLCDLEMSHPCVRPLLSSISLPLTPEAGGSEILVGAPTPPIIQPPPPNWQSLIAGIQSTDPLTALQEVEHLTVKRPHLLETIAQNLYHCIGSRNGQVRVVSIKLMSRYLKYNPKASSDALPSVLACLDSRDADVVDSILERLPELIIVMQEYAKAILTRVYQLGIQSNLNACTNVGKCIASLCLQQGC